MNLGLRASVDDYDMMAIMRPVQHMFKLRRR